MRGIHGNCQGDVSVYNWPGTIDDDLRILLCNLDGIDEQLKHYNLDELKDRMVVLIVVDHKKNVTAVQNNSG